MVDRKGGDFASGRACTKYTQTHMGLGANGTDPIDTLPSDSRQGLAAGDFPVCQYRHLLEFCDRWLAPR